jgi:UTP--glucose-1-phosphate uridylyltransferase
MLMNSPSTRGPSLAALGRHPAVQDNGPVPLDFLQGREPKIRLDDHFPVEWPQAPELEWCPPGHGDLYTALSASGTLDALLEAGVRWCFVSNADNLGAVPDARLAAWVADEGVPFAMEAVRGTPADRKGGHLALHRGRTVLRETAQVPPGDESFSDVERWRFYNTNNLWIDLEALRRLQRDDPGGPALPLIVNRKTVDPSDATSTPVIQLETAMGAAIGSIEGARAVQVPRHRFAPVKTTDDLLVVRSDCYELSPDGRMQAVFDGPPPFVALDKAHYKLLPGFEARFPEGAPSLRRCDSLTVSGDVTFGAGVVVEGTVVVEGPRHVSDGEILRG